MGPGRRPDYEDWKMAVLIMAAVLKKRKSKSAQYRFLHEHRQSLMELLDLASFPARSTYFDRYRRVRELFEIAIRLQGRKAIAEGVAQAEIVAVDQSFVEARGPEWHRNDRRANRIPKKLRGVDRDCGWGYCAHHGWVQGYSYEVVVTASRGSTVLPLLASVQPANKRESVTFGPKIDRLPRQARYVLADGAYDCNVYGDRIEYDDRWRLTGCRFVCPPRKRAQPGSTPKKNRRAARARRNRRISFYDSKRGRRLAARRGRSVEPFNEWFKSLFELDGRVWHRGLGNNQTQILAALLGYQLLLRYNRRRGHHNGQVKWILDGL